MPHGLEHRLIRKRPLHRTEAALAILEVTVDLNPTSEDLGQNHMKHLKHLLRPCLTQKKRSHHRKRRLIAKVMKIKRTRKKSRWSQAHQSSRSDSIPARRHGRRRDLTNLRRPCQLRVAIQAPSCLLLRVHSQMYRRPQSRSTLPTSYVPERPIPLTVAHIKHSFSSKKNRRTNLLQAIDSLRCRSSKDSRSTTRRRMK